MKKRAAPEGNGNTLAETVTCKICKEVLVLPKSPPIVGMEPKVQAYADGFYKGIMMHMSRKHKDAQPIAIQWASMFSELLILHMFDCTLSESLQQQYDVKRLQVLRLFQREPLKSYNPALMENVGASIHQTCEYYEETELCAQLEAAGFKLATGILPESSSIIKA